MFAKTFYRPRISNTIYKFKNSIMKQIYRFSLICLCLLLTSRVSIGQTEGVHTDDFLSMAEKNYSNGFTTDLGWSASYCDRYQDFICLFSWLKSPVFPNGCNSVSFKYTKDDYYNGGHPSMRVDIMQIKDGEATIVWSDTINDKDVKELKFREVTYDRLKIEDSVQLVVTRLSPNNISGRPPKGDVPDVKEFRMTDYIRDVVPPTAPTAIEAQTELTTVTLSWIASTDNIGVEGYRVYCNGDLVNTVTETSCVITGLNPETTYTFEVEAYDDDANKSARVSLVSSTLTDNSAPTIPIDLIGVSKDCGMILSWSASTDNVGVVKYNVYAGGNLVGSTALTTDTITGLTDDTNYLFEVEAEDISGNKSTKVAATISTTIDKTVPTVPTDLQANAEDSKMIVSWTASTDNFGVEKYNIYLDGDLVSSTSATTDTISNLTPNTAYQIDVEAEDATGNKSTKATVTSSTGADNTAPTTPTAFEAKATNEGVLLSWTAATDNFSVDKYHIYANGDLIDSTTIVSDRIQGLTAGIDYLLEIEAEDVSGNKSEKSSFTLSADSTAQFAFTYKNNVKVSHIRQTRDHRMSVMFTSVFDYPEEIETRTEISKRDDITISYSSTNEENLKADGYYQHSSRGQYFYYNSLAGAYGQDTLTISIDYNGYNAKTQVIANVAPISAANDTHTMDIGDTLKINAAGNDNPNTYINKTSLVLLDDVNFGTLTNNNDGTITYINEVTTPNYSVEKVRYSIEDTEGHCDTATVTINIHKNSYASRVIDFLPAPGQFTNTSIGQSNSAEKTLGPDGYMISLGAFGGYVIFGFDQSIVNNPKNPYGVDFSIKGNSFAANLYGVWTEPAAVRVMKDKNGDGIPNDGEWYELAGSDYYMSSTEKNVKMTYYNPHYNGRYTVPWEKSTGETGALLSNAFHQQAYYPDPFDFGCDRDSVTYEGTIIKSSLDMSTPSYIEFYRAPFFGYCDNRGNSSDLTNPQNPYFADDKGKAADGFDLSWAVDRDGNHIELDSVDFIKVYTGGFANAGWLGEWSSEVGSIGITTPDPDYVPEDYYINYIGITQLKVLKGQTCQFEGFLFKNGIPQSEGTQQWSTSVDSVGTVDNTGLFTAVENGETYLRFSQKSDVPTDSIRLLVVELTGVHMEMEGNTGSADSTDLLNGETISITAQSIDNIGDVLNGSKANRFTYDTYTWTTSNPEVGTINNGLFSGKKVGRTMVYARSNSNPEYADSMLVIVRSMPTIDVENDTVYVAYNNSVGAKTATELFTTTTNATVYIDSVSSKNGLAKPVIDKNNLTCNFTEGVYGVDTLSFDLSWYNKDTTIDVVFIYEPDAYATDAQVVFVNNANKSSLVTYRSGLDSTIVIDDQLAANSVKDVLVDGAFAFVSGDTYLSKYNLTNYEQTASIAIDNSGNGAMSVYGNLLLVAEQSDLAMYYKTDLAFCKKIAFDGIINDVEVVGDKAFVLLDDEVTNELTTIATVEFVKGEVERIDAISDTAFVVSSVMSNDTSIFFVGTGSGVSAVLEYNTLTNTDFEVRTLTDIIDIHNANAVINGDTMLIPCGAGVVVYNMTAGAYGTDTLMKASDDLFPTSIVYHDSLEQYFVTYSNVDKTISKGLVFGVDFVQVGTIDSVRGAPAYLSSVNAIENNCNPQMVESLSMSNVTTYEQYTRNKSMYVYDNRFADADGDFTVYTRYLEHLPWLTWNNSYSSTTRKRYYAKYTGTVDADSVVTIPVEAIDEWGFSATRTFDITIRARVVKPVVDNPIADTIVVKNTDSIQIALSDVFLETSTSGVSFGKAVSNNSDTALVATSIANDTLTLVFTPDTVGFAYITIKDSARHSSYGVKYVETTFKVTVKDTVCPTMPTNLMGTPSETNIAYSWDASEDNYGVANYVVYMDSVVLDTITDTTYTVLDLNPATEYTFSVVACDEYGNESEPASVTLSTTDETAPSVPADLTATVAENSITLLWSASTDNDAVEGYVVYVDGDSVDVVTDTTFIVDGLTAFTEYNFEVVAYDASGNMSEKVSLKASTIDETAPSAPTDLLATATDTTMVFSWSASTDNVATKGYIVYLDNDSINTVVDTFCTIKNLQSATEYTLGVKAYDASGNCSEMAEITRETTLLFEIESDGLKVYPNPCSDHFILETGSEEDLVIYDLTGRVKIRMTCHKGRNRVDVSGLATGIYYLKQGTSILKMIKK